MKTLNEISNKLLKRKEVKLSLEAKSNPGFKIAEEVATHFKSSPEMVVIKKIGSGFGRSEFIIEAFIYDNAEAKAIEPRPKIKKDPNAPAAQAAPAGAK